MKHSCKTKHGIISYTMNGTIVPKRTTQPILFLHSLGSCCEDWEFQMKKFQHRHLVIVPDLPGHGSSEYTGPYSIEALADEVYQLLVFLGIGSCHVVSLSLGGCVALSLTIKHPEVIKSLSICNSFAKFEPAGIDGRINLIQRLWYMVLGDMNDVARIIAKHLFQDNSLIQICQQRIAQNSKSVYWKLLWAIYKFDVRKQLKNIHCPTFIILGDNDKTVSFSARILLYRKIKASKIIFIKQSGHASPYDQPEEFNRELKQFIESVEKSKKH